MTSPGLALPEHLAKELNAQHRQEQADGQGQQMQNAAANQWRSDVAGMAAQVLPGIVDRGLLFHQSEKQQRKHIREAVDCALEIARRLAVKSMHLRTPSPKEIMAAIESDNVHYQKDLEEAREIAGEQAQA